MRLPPDPSCRVPTSAMHGLMLVRMPDNQYVAHPTAVPQLACPKAVTPLCAMGVCLSQPAEGISHKGARKTGHHKQASSSKVCAYGHCHCHAKQQ